MKSSSRSILTFLLTILSSTLAKDTALELGEFASANPELLGAIQNIVQSGNDITSDLLTTMLSEERDNFRTSHMLLNALDRKLTKHQIALTEVLHNILDRMRLSEGATTYVGKPFKLEKNDSSAEENEEESGTEATAIPVVLTEEEKFYISTNDGFKWSAAAEFCSSHNWTLASLSTVEEMSLIWHLAPNKDGWYWTSASDAGHSPGHFFWHDSQTEVPSNLWASGQPNEFAKDYTACAALNDGKLFDHDCSYSNHFVCQKF